MPEKKYNCAAFNEYFLEFTAYAALLVFISAVWMETDAYRFAAAALIPATVYYFRNEFPNKEKILIGYIGFLCIGWAIYVIFRFAYSYTFYPELGIGSSEGIYIFPLFYTISGYALFLYIRRPLVVISAFILISFLVILITADPLAFTEGDRAEVALQNNPIHAAVAQGMIVLCVLPFISYLMRTDNLRSELRLGLIVISVASLFVGLANIYALQSKGVWLALAVALPCQLLLMATMLGARRGFGLMMALSFIAVAGAVLVAWDGVREVANDTAQAALGILSDVFGGEGVLQAMDHAIHDDTVPSTFRQRLMLWASALLIWAEDPIFGQGVSWLHEWQTRAYPDADYNLLHNGYLEIAIRYGIVGLGFYVVLFTWAARQVWRAKDEGLIDPAAFHAYVSVLLFFSMTILSNSNIRLAIGESYMWFAAAFGFYCYYHRQQKRSVEVNTWM